VRLTQYMKSLFEHDMAEDSRRFHSGNGGASETSTMEIAGQSGSGRTPRPERTPSQPSRQTRLASTPRRRSLQKKKKGVSAFWSMILTMGLVLGSSVALARINPPFVEKLSRTYPPVNLAVNRLALWPVKAKDLGSMLGASLKDSVKGKPRPGPSSEPPVEVAAVVPPEEEPALEFVSDEGLSSEIAEATTGLSVEGDAPSNEPKRSFTPEEKQEIRDLLENAKLAYNEGKLEEVEQMLHRLINLNPTIPVTYHLLGTVRKEQKDPEGAIRIFAEASRRFPDYALLHYDLGFLYFKNGVDSLAKDELLKGVALDPESPMADRARKALNQLGVTPETPPVTGQAVVE
ncbi:MAG TPA: tetratricopeptide repeat protein, partial [Nitrospiria bacterium]|nr:tetratricopeptide repeat protein [Nitrospiria bacterium]